MFMSENAFTLFQCQNVARFATSSLNEAARRIVLRGEPNSHESTLRASNSSLIRTSLMYTLKLDRPNLAAIARNSWFLLGIIALAVSTDQQTDTEIRSKMG